jgi:hypothetical protein
MIHGLAQRGFRPILDKRATRASDDTGRGFVRVHLGAKIT